jgi:hypothetical protein
MNLFLNQEKSVIEKKLESERAELKSAQFKIQMLEHQIMEKDKISVVSWLVLYL